VEAHFEKLRIKGYRKALYGAIPLAALIFVFPTLFGEGYESIKVLSNSHPEELLNNTMLEPFKENGWVLLIFVGLSMMVKAYATGLTLASGGNGGNFAPSLFVGSYLGYFVAKLFTLIGFSNDIPVSNFTIVGMAGILSGLFHAPLTSIFLIGEITGGYGLMVPLMIVSSISFAVSKQFEKHSMDIKHLAAKGQVFTSDKDKNILSGIDILEVIDTDLQTLSPNQKTEDVIGLIATTKQTIFAVIDEKKRLLGIIDFDKVRPILFNQFQIKHTPFQDIIATPVQIACMEDSIEMIMEKFEATTADYLPLIKEDRYYGFIYKSKILEAYRAKLKEMIIE
jgi:CIC family chloride channel protein